MQWLIDTIKELIHGQLGFFDRGDPVAYDFQKADFTTDNSWRDLDLSPIVPADAKLILLRIRLTGNAIGAVARFRTKGYVNSSNIPNPGLMVANILHRYDIFVAPDSNRFVQYRISNIIWANVDVTVGGWWLR